MDNLKNIAIRLPCGMGDMLEGRFYSLESVLDYISSLENRIEELEHELTIELEIRETYYHPVSNYALVGMSEHDFI